MTFPSQICFLRLRTGQLPRLRDQGQLKSREELVHLRTKKRMGSPTISSLLAVTTALTFLLVLNGFFVMSNARPAPAKPMVLWLGDPRDTVSGPIRDIEAFPAEVKGRSRVLKAKYGTPSPLAGRPSRPHPPIDDWDSEGRRI